MSNSFAPISFCVTYTKSILSGWLVDSLKLKAPLTPYITEVRVLMKLGTVIGSFFMGEKLG